MCWKILAWVIFVLLDNKVDCLFIMAIDIILFDAWYLLSHCGWKTGIHSFAMDLTLCFKQVEECCRQQLIVTMKDEFKMN